MLGHQLLLVLKFCLENVLWLFQPRAFEPFETRSIVPGLIFLGEMEEKVVTSHMFLDFCFELLRLLLMNELLLLLEL